MPAIQEAALAQYSYLKSFDSFMDGGECTRCGGDVECIAYVGRMHEGAVDKQEHYGMCNACADMMASYIRERLTKRQKERRSNST